MPERQTPDVYRRAEQLESLVARGRLLHGQAMLASAAALRRALASLWRRCFRQDAGSPLRQA